MLTEKRVNVDDLRDVLKFWEMKEEIFDALLILLRLKNTVSFTEDSYKQTANLINKIESIGKKGHDARE